MNKSAIYWGTFLITIGALLLLKSLGALNADMTLFIKLWPLFFVFWGLSIIKFPEIIRKALIVLSALFLALFLFSFFTNGWSFSKHHIFHWNHADRYEKKYNVERAMLTFDSTVKKGSLNLKFGAGTFTITEPTDKFIDAKGSNFSFNDRKDSGSQSQVAVNIDAPKQEWIERTIKGAFDLDLKLNKGIEWYLYADFGAADVNMDLSPYVIPSININSGATSVVIKLGSLTPNQNVSIDCGASDIFIRIPKDSGCRIYSNTVLSGKDYEGFLETDDGFLTSNYSQSQNKIEIKLNGAISNFNIVKY